MLRRDDAWVWDSWVVDDGELFHLFFLTAPRALGRFDARHTAARIGHATSVDLVHWEPRPDALGPGPCGWDDLAVWTGSVVRAPDGGWLMFYTAVNTGGYGLRDQRIGVAGSDDLTTWRRLSDEPVLAVGSSWYRTLDDDPTVSETWRDPFVFRDPDGDGWRMLVTARAAGGAHHDDGVLAEARSTDLLHWELGPPVTEPGHGFGQLEVPQVRLVDGVPTLVFTCEPTEMSAARLAAGARWCTWSVTGPSLAGPWDISRAQPFVEEPDLFAAPLVQRRDGSWVLLGFRNLERHGVDAFEIVDPIPVALRNGRLVRVE
ncbi:glycosyl hydrolase [Jatrophihabitans sp. YIM 134969]